MLAFGLNKKLCSDFLKKQAVIGNLDEGELGKGYGGEAGARVSPLHWGFSPCQRRAPAMETCFPGLPSFLNPRNVYSGCVAGSRVW